MPEIADMNSLRLLVFDWDGTLMDSIGPIVACTQAAIRELDLGDVPEATIRGTVGLGLRETIEVLSPGCDDQLFGRILEGYRKHWYATYRDMPLLFSGVGEMLRSLAEEGYLLAIATGKSRRGLDYVLDQTGLRELFQATRTADEAFSKPHPQMLFDILDELGVAPREAVMIGDTTFDLEMARSARTHGIGVCSGGHCREELLRLEPLACLDQVVELAPWLAGRSAAVTR
jgi:phosphoglycolate phosphatase